MMVQTVISIAVLLVVLHQAQAGRICQYVQNRPGQHSYGGVPVKRITADDSSTALCEKACTDQEGCKGYDWNISETPYQNVRCWLHIGDFGELHDNENVNQFDAYCFEF